MLHSFSFMAEEARHFRGCWKHESLWRWTHLQCMLGAS